MPTTYRIKLTPAMPELIKFSGRDYFRVQITASDALNMPAEVFIHQRTLVDANTSRQQDEFCAIAGPYDLSTYPANAPTAGQDPPFFRKSTIDVLLPSSSLANDFIAAVDEQVCALITALSSVDTLVAGEPIWCPSAPTTTTTTSTRTSTTTTTSTSTTTSTTTTTASP